MGIYFDSSFFQLRARRKDGSLMSNSEKKQEVRKAAWLWDRWALNFTKRAMPNIRVAAMYSGKAWSGAYFPDQFTMYFALDWIWPWTSVPRVGCHEMGHSAGLWNNGQHPPANGDWSYIMSTGARGWHGQLHPSEARWAVGRVGLGPHPYHPDVRAYHRKATRSRTQYATLGKRIRALRADITPLRKKLKAGNATPAEIRELQKLNARMQRWLTTRNEWREEWANWQKTVDPTVLRIGKGYGNLHRPMLPEQFKANASSEVPDIEDGILGRPIGSLEEGPATRFIGCHVIDVTELEASTVLGV
jgi:hypothetical protein